MASPDQRQAPYLNVIVAYGIPAPPFHVPGHKAGTAPISARAP